MTTNRWAWSVAGLVAGIAGALVAVPFVAAANAVVLHLADHARVAREAEEVPVGDSPSDQAAT